MASCFCGCGTKVKFGMRPINSRGAKITGLLDRLNVMLDGYEQQAGRTNTQNLSAFRDEGSIYALNLVTFVHLGDSPPPAMQAMTQNWLSRERKLYLDSRNPERAFIAMLHGSLSAQGLAETEVDAEFAKKIANGEVDLFAALVPDRENAAAYEVLAQVGVGADLIDAPTAYEPTYRN